MERIYLDHAAATPLDPRVLEKMMPYLTAEFGNPSSLHFWGQHARAAVQKAREQVAHCMGVNASDIVFTSGGTEADNLAILGYLRANYPNGGHLITTAAEHQAVLNTFDALSKSGYDVTVLPVDATGRICPADVQSALREDTILVSVMYANNETGMIQPIGEIGKITYERNIAFHVDAVQAFGYLPICPVKEHIDLLSVCSHKIYGPKGIGALYIRSGIPIAPEAHGGPQEHHVRAGTENVPGIVGIGAASAILETERQERYAHAAVLKKYMYEHLIAPNAMYHLNGTMADSLPNIIDFSIAGIDNAVLLIAMDMKGIGISAGSACEACAVEPSHVLQAMGVGDAWIRGSVRISFGVDNNIAQIKRTIDTMEEYVNNMTGKKSHE